jgi:hypothetical protein
VVGFVLNVYVMCIGRGVVGVWRVWGRGAGEQTLGGRGEFGRGELGAGRQLQGQGGDRGGETGAVTGRVGMFGLGAVGVGTVVGF